MRTWEGLPERLGTWVLDPLPPLLPGPIASPYTKGVLVKYSLTPFPCSLYSFSPGNVVTGLSLKELKKWMMTMQAVHCGCTSLYIFARELSRHTALLVPTGLWGEQGSVSPRSLWLCGVTACALYTLGS